MSLEGKVVVLIRTSSNARVEPYAHIKSLGVTLVMVHPVVNPEFDGIFDLWIPCETTCFETLTTTLDAALKSANLVPDVICSFDEFGVYPAARLNERLGKRPYPMASEKIRENNIKSLFREFCQRNGVSAPKATYVSEGNFDFKNAIEAAGLEFPIVMKPSPGAGSLMAKLCKDIDEVNCHGKIMWDAFAVHKDVLQFKALGTPQQIMLEEYIGGQEVDVDCLIVDGEVKFSAVSDNFDTVPPYFVEMGGLCPSELSAPHQEALQQLLKSFVAAHGTEISGVLHFEAKYDFQRKGAYVIEVNCRMGSAETYTNVKNAFGFNLAEGFIRCVLQAPLDNLFEQHRAALDDKGVPRQYCASVNIYPKAYGILRSATIIEDENFLGGKIGPEIGTIVGPPPRIFYMLCWISAKGATPEEAKANINRLTALVEQDIDEDVPENK